MTHPHSHPYAVLVQAVGAQGAPWHAGVRVRKCSVTLTAGARLITARTPDPPTGELVPPGSPSQPRDSHTRVSPTPTKPLSYVTGTCGGVLQVLTSVHRLTRAKALFIFDFRKTILNCIVVRRTTRIPQQDPRRQWFCQCAQWHGSALIMITRGVLRGSLLKWVRATPDDPCHSPLHPQCAVTCSDRGCARTATWCAPGCWAVGRADASVVGKGRG